MSDSYPAKLVHLDLADGDIKEPLDIGQSAVRLVFWWRGIPLGHKHIPKGALLMTKAHVWSLAAQTVAPAVDAYVLTHGFEGLPTDCPIDRSSIDPPDLDALLALDKPLHMLDQQPPKSHAASISVIICTRDRSESLKRCLESLLRCTPPADEILVVDNCPGCDATRQLVRCYPAIRYVLELKPGLDNARNAGIRQSRGQIIAFADDDVTVHCDWVGRIAQCFTSPQVMAATGLVLAAELKTEAQWLFEKYWSFNRGYSVVTYDSQYFETLKAWGVPAWDLGAGANMAFRRQVFDLVGDFDVRLDVGAAGCSGDSELWYRLLAAGLICRYEPRAVVFHYHRTEMADLKNQLYFYLRGHTAALLFQFAKHRHWGNLVRLLWLPIYYAKLIAQGMLFGFSSRHRLIPTECKGCSSGLLFFFRHRHSDSN